MKSILSYSLLAAAAAAGVATGQTTTATTTPVGYVSIGNPQGAAVPAASDTPVAIPIERAAEFAGSVASVAAGQFTLANSPNLTASQFVTGGPYILKVESGLKSGLTAVVTANNTNSITVAFQTGDSSADVVAGDKVTIRKAWTLGSLFQGATLPDNTELLVNSGSAVGVNLAPDLLYIYSGGQWYDQGSGDLATNVVLYSGESFVIRNNSLTPIPTIVVSGEVPTSKARIRVFGGANPQDTRISYPTPVEEAIGVSGLGFRDNDELLVFSDSSTGKDISPSTLLIYSGGQWYDQGSGDNVSTSFKLKAGRGYVYRSAAGSPGGVTSDEPAYKAGL